MKQGGCQPPRAALLAHMGQNRRRKAQRSGLMSSWRALGAACRFPVPRMEAARFVGALFLPGGSFDAGGACSVLQAVEWA